MVKKVNKNKLSLGEVTDPATNPIADPTTNPVTDPVVVDQVVPQNTVNSNPMMNTMFFLILLAALFAGGLGLTAYKSRKDVVVAPVSLPVK